MTVDRPRGTSRADLFMLMAVSVAAFVVVIVSFSPRYVFWPFIDVDPAEQHPSEFKRAIDTLRQLDNPFIRITSPSNRVINWRLLFPMLGHYLHMPVWAFLGLPAIGCLLVLGFVAQLVRRESGTWWTALAASMLTATTSWFFVSTGWLAYFDSWCVLGLLVATFCPSKVATGLACLLTPWVDERFVLTLPLIVVVRVINSSGIGGASRVRLRSDALRFLALVAPYCALRLLALATTQDEGSAFHLRSHLTSAHNPWQVADGLWSGLRALWAFVAVAPALVFIKQQAVQAGLLSLTALVTLALNVPLAHDISRSSSTMIPAAVLGVVLLVRARPSLAKCSLAAALVLNLLTPARHVVEGWEQAVAIEPLHVELDHVIHPPTQLTGLYLLRAAKLVRQHQLERALAAVDTAVRIGPGSYGAQVNRAILLNKLGRTAEAAAVYDTAVRLAPDRPEVYLQRSHFRHARGQLKAAAQDLRMAVELSPAGSTIRAELEHDLAEARRGLGEP
jgi:tetratricopeptide (TPR) repeat protein